MGWALDVKRHGGKAPAKIKKVTESMSEEQIKDFAGTRTKNLPEHKEAGMRRMRELYGSRQT